MKNFAHIVSDSMDPVAYNDLCLLDVMGELNNTQQLRLSRIRTAWNFYEGYHWEDIPETDKPQITTNYCRPFVNKFVAFELGSGFKIGTDTEILDKYKENEPTHIDFLNDVWDISKRDTLCTELGQSKSITGDGWLQIRFYESNELPFPTSLEYPKGMIKVSVIPTNIVFAKYDSHERDRLTELTIAYPINKTKTGILGNTSTEKVVYKQVWTVDRIQEFEGKNLIKDIPNPYNLIPFVQIKNFPVAGRSEGVGDLEDLIPLNIELNIKKSDVSEIIDYHSAPVTIVFGGTTSTLERGANKVWSGLPKDAKVQNLELTSDLSASMHYIDDLKSDMHVVGGVPKGALSGEQNISNTSGVALQFVNMPLIEKTKIKRAETKEGLQLANKIILHMGQTRNLITKPHDMPNKDFYHNEVTLVDNLPKDRLIELQALEAELKMEVESVHGAMKRLGKVDIEQTLDEIKQEKLAKAELSADVSILTMEKTMEAKEKLGLVDEENKQAIPISNKPQGNPTQPNYKKLNSGMTNGETQQELGRKTTIGENISQSVANKQQQ